MGRRHNRNNDNNAIDTWRGTGQRAGCWKGQKKMRINGKEAHKTYARYGRIETVDWFIGPGINHVRQSNEL